MARCLVTVLDDRGSHDMQSADGSGAGRRDPRYDILFEAAQIGPVTARAVTVMRKNWKSRTLAMPCHSGARLRD